MSRTANRYLKKNPETKDRTKTFYAGNYLRLSVDSDYTGSDSLENQRKLAREYVCRVQGIAIIKEYVDDGKTGTNFERPAFTRMLADLRQGIINCVIVKDLSRFGREYIEAGNYIEKVFPFLGVRFISIVDQYDSENPYCDRELLLISLKNLMHEMYARDISKKVGSTFRMKHEKRMFYRSSTIPYGYKMDLEGENYSVDEPAAAVVREIFTQYCRGTSKYMICQMLYENHVMTPAQYRQTGRLCRNGTDEQKIRNLSTIDRMLKNPVYMGSILRHKTEQSLFEGRKAVRIPESEWALLSDNHEPIISEYMFLEAQNRLQQVKTEYKEYRKDSDSVKEQLVFGCNAFHGKLFCGSCRASMVRTGAYRTVHGELERYKIFRCSTHRNLSAGCDSRYIEEEVLCDMVYATIQKHLLLIKGVKKLAEKDVNDSFAYRLEHIDHKKQRIRSQLVMLQQEYMRVYTLYIEKNLSAERFQDFRLSYQRKQKRCNRQLQELEAEESSVKKCRADLKKLVMEWMRFDACSKLTESMIENCLERIDVFPDRRIEIKLRYQDCFVLLEEWAKGGASDS